MKHKPQKSERYEALVEKYAGEESVAEQEKKRYEALLENSKKMKRRILIIMGCVVAIILLLIACIRILQWVEARNAGNSKTPDSDITFSPTYEGDIMENKDYLELNRLVYYCSDPYGYGVTKAVTDKNRDDFNANVLFLCDYIQTIIAGDDEAYNACFNEVYFQDSDRQEPFSQQMLYNIKIHFYMRESANLVTYRLDYMIYRNDGTFRRDMGSDVSRYQLITLRIADNGEISIEKLRTP